MGADFQVTIHHPERRARWLAWVGTDTVCVRSPQPVMATVEGLGRVLVYLVDEHQLSDEQQDRLVQGIADHFRAPPGEVRQQMCGPGMVILATDCRLTVLHPQRLMD